MEKGFAKFTDEELVRLAQEGNLDAEEYLIRKYKEMIRAKSQFYFIIGAETDDVVQEGMIGLFKAIQSFRVDRDARFRTFAELCVNRQIISAIKIASRKKHEPLNDSVSLNHLIHDEKSDTTIGESLRASNDTEPEEELLMKVLMEEINHGQTFSSFELQVWNEYIKGKDYREIAMDLRKNPKAIDNAIQRTKKKIIESLSC